MKRYLILSIYLLVLNVTTSYASSLHNSDAAELTHDKVGLILNELSSLLSQHYVHQTKGKEYADSLNALASSHELFSITDPDQFKVAVSDYLKAIHPDGHLRVYDPATTKRLLEDSNFYDEHDPQSQEHEQFLEIEHQSKRFVHLSISSLPYGETYEREAVNLLASLPKTDQLVLDLRFNSGGSARTVREMLNCLLPKATPLYSLVVSSGKEKGEYSHTSQPIASCSDIANTPITVLVSEQTASAAELLTLILKNRKRALVVGKKTYGAGNPVELFMLPYDYSVYIPISTIVDSLTGKGFEMTGVEPEIAIE